MGRINGWLHRVDGETVAGTIYQAFTVQFARAASEAAIGDPEEAKRWRSKAKLGFTPMISAPWRFHARLLELWDEGDPELIGGRFWDYLRSASVWRAVDHLETRYRHGPRAQ